MRTIKGPGLFLAQFARDTPPHNSLEGIARWAKAYGYKAIQIPTWDSRFFNLDRAHDSAAGAIIHGLAAAYARLTES